MSAFAAKRFPALIYLRKEAKKLAKSEIAYYLSYFRLYDKWDLMSIFFYKGGGIFEEGAKAKYGF